MHTFRNLAVLPLLTLSGCYIDNWGDPGGGYCNQGCPGWACNHTSDCHSSCGCHSGSCETLPSCATTADCTSGQSCVQGVCEDGCKSNADTGETTGSDRRCYDVKRYRRQP